MAMSTEPLVSVLTPVYNGAKYLEECIESVLAQTYRNWDYRIVNNRSTDGTREIAERYAMLDPRISVVDNAEHLPIIANHNRAFRLISPDSKYCKIVSGDDWLFPECLTRMVELAEVNPSVGFVCSYQLSGGAAKWRGFPEWKVSWDGLPYAVKVMPGREIARMTLLGKIYVFGSPTSTLYSSRIVRATDEFYPNATAQADVSSFYKHLKDCDYGFVHQVLSCERVHELAISATQSRRLNTNVSSSLRDLSTYGRWYLTEEEYEVRLKQTIRNYYKVLATGFLNRSSQDFWDYHKRALEELGYPLNKAKLSLSVLEKILDLLLNPKQAVEKALNRAR
jgi:glycosyltransferase involved in cell wall biosynthesis